MIQRGDGWHLMDRRGCRYSRIIIIITGAGIIIIMIGGYQSTGGLTIIDFGSGMMFKRLTWFRHDTIFGSVGGIIRAGGTFFVLGHGSHFARVAGRGGCGLFSTIDSANTDKQVPVHISTGRLMNLSESNIDNYIRLDRLAVMDGTTILSTCMEYGVERKVAFWM